HQTTRPDSSGFRLVLGGFLAFLVGEAAEQDAKLEQNPHGHGQQRLGDDVGWCQQHADDEAAHHHIGAFGGQVLRRGGAGQDQQNGGDGNFKRHAKGEEHFQNKVQVAGDVRQFHDAFRAYGSKKTEHQRKHHKVGKRCPAVEQNDGG